MNRLTGQIHVLLQDETAITLILVQIIKFIALSQEMPNQKTCTYLIKRSNELFI